MVALKLWVAMGRAERDVVTPQCTQMRPYETKTKATPSRSYVAALTQDCN